MIAYTFLVKSTFLYSFEYDQNWFNTKCTGSANGFDISLGNSKLSFWKERNSHKDVPLFMYLPNIWRRKLLVSLRITCTIHHWGLPSQVTSEAYPLESSLRLILSSHIWSLSSQVASSLSSWVASEAYPPNFSRLRLKLRVGTYAYPVL